MTASVLTSNGNSIAIEDRLRWTKQSKGLAFWSKITGIPEIRELSPDWPTEPLR